MRPIRHLPVVDANAAAKALAHADAMAIAGGTNVVDLLRIGVVGPAKIVDVTSLPLSKIETDGLGLRIGALVRNSDLANHETVRTKYPVLSEALLSGASPQIRNMATTAGNMLQRTRCWYFRDTSARCNKRTPGSGCDALEGENRIHAIVGGSDACIAVHPSDMCVALSALDATVVIVGPKGERRVPFVDFHRVPGSTPHIESVLEPGELVTAVILPAPLPKSRYLKVRDRDSFAFALVSVAVAVNLEGGVIKDARVALGGIGTKPWRSREAEAALIGKSPAEAAFSAAASAVVRDAKPRRDNAFKVELAKRAVVRVLGEVTT